MHMHMHGRNRLVRQAALLHFFGRPKIFEVAPNGFSRPAGVHWLWLEACSIRAPIVVVLIRTVRLFVRLVPPVYQADLPACTSTCAACYAALRASCTCSAMQSCPRLG